MYAEELCFAPKYVRAKELADEGALGARPPGPAGRAALRPARGLVLGSPTASGGGVLMDMGCHGDRVRPLDVRQAAGGVGHRRAGHLRPRRPHAGRGPRHRHRALRRQPAGRGRDELGEAAAGWTTAPSCSAREGVTYVDLLRGSSLHDLQRARLRLRGREGAADERLDVHDVRGDLELRLPAGDAPLRRLRALAARSRRDRRRRPRGARDHLRHVPGRRRRRPRGAAARARRGGSPPARRTCCWKEPAAAR